ncbi:hypothetical protein [Gimesia panareensis]|uniref:hypothetical protein n=1 Tax=Gimesia panareensis TaxID=2527978 RepID=UPI001188D844|nr:hypothetical protein [Gimesia panareensis]QDU51247.1 hypothetical protein Pan110_36110 [Gimesia panareensis]
MSLVRTLDRHSQRTESVPGRLAAIRIALFSFLRGIPLFFSSRPATPLRVLCLIAFDTVHVLRTSRRLSVQKIRELAALLDFGSYANDYFDGKQFSFEKYQMTRRLLKAEDTDLVVRAYLHRLRELEKQRPAAGGDDRMHSRAQLYREAVVRLSLGMLAAASLEEMTVEEGIEATLQTADFELLFRIVMLCQVIDDVIDYRQDADAGLPGLMTCSTSPTRALKLTSASAARYADQRSLSTSPALFPFRLALWGVATLTRATLFYGYCRLSLSAVWHWFASLSNSASSTDVAA